MSAMSGMPKKVQDTISFN